MSFQQPLRCFSELVDHLRLTHILQNCLFLAHVGFKFLDELGDCLSLFVHLALPEHTGTF